MCVKAVEVRVLPDGRMDATNASAYLGVSEKTLAAWRSNGKGPRYIKRGRIFYFQSDLDEFIQGNGRQESTAQNGLRIKTLATE